MNSQENSAAVEESAATVESPKSTKKASTKKASSKKKGGSKASAKKASKGSTKKSSSKKASTKSETKAGNTLPDNQLTALKHLSKSGEKTRSEIRAATKIQTLGLPALIKEGLVEEVVYEGSREHYFNITTKGKKELAKQKK